LRFESWKINVELVVKEEEVVVAVITVNAISEKEKAGLSVSFREPV
jgi:hypothetical protein